MPSTLDAVALVDVRTPSYQQSYPEEECEMLRPKRMVVGPAHLARAHPRCRPKLAHEPLSLPVSLGSNPGRGVDASAGSSLGLKAWSTDTGQTQPATGLGSRERIGSADRRSRVPVAEACRDTIDIRRRATILKILPIRVQHRVLEPTHAHQTGFSVCLSRASSH